MSKIWTDSKIPVEKRLFLLIFGKYLIFWPMITSRFFMELVFVAFLVISDIIFNFCRIQSILVKNDIFAHFCKILPISDYLFDFWNSFIFGKWRSIFLGRKRTLKNLSERSIETKSIGSARRKNSNFSWNNTLFWVV